jgi:UDP-3-O-[3-hydroxymyristoyl] glucosamine N-acyltransferase
MELEVKQIAAHIDAQIQGDPNYKIRGVAPFDQAGNDQITFADGRKMLRRLSETGAGAIIVPESVDSDTLNLLKVSHPKVAFAKILQLFYSPAKPEQGISPMAAIGEQFQHGKKVAIGPLVSIGNRVVLGDKVQLHPGVVIGDDVVIGNDVLIYPNVSVLERCRIGNRVIIHTGTVIGSDGFGYASDGRIHHKIPQTGFVQIDDDVEIGACNTIDRATFGYTHIQEGVKTDNMVHIAHNVTVGEYTIIVAQVVIGGSATIGKRVLIAGGAAISDHVSIGDGAIIGPRAGIAKAVPDGHVMSGAPEMPHRQWLKMSKILPQLPDLKKKVLAIEKQLKQLKAADRT